jgi:ketol-acid reductoisomerase
VEQDIKHMKTTIIGFGNQASAWALNLRDSGHDFNLLVRSESSMIRAKELGFEARLIGQIDFDPSECFILLLPDQAHLAALKILEGKINPDALIVLAHGHSFAYQAINQIYPSFNFALLAPKAIATELRYNYQHKKNLGAVYSLDGVSQEKKSLVRTHLINLARCIGITDGPFESSMKQETDADLFSEQTLLCGLYPFMINAAFNFLVKKGVPAELAYYECFEESYLIMKSLHQLGPKAFFDMISPYALVGAHKAQSMLIDQHMLEKMEQLWSEIQDGSFEKMAHESASQLLIRQQLNNFWSESSLYKTFVKINGENSI